MVIVNKTAQKNAFDALAGMNIKYELYHKFQIEYKKIVNAYHNAFAEAQSDPEQSLNWPETYRKFVAQINIALEHWKVFGYKSEIESAIGTQKCHPLILNKLTPIRAVTR